MSSETNPLSYPRPHPTSASWQSLTAPVKQTLVARELQQDQALKAALEARRAQRYREELWDQEFFDRANHASRVLEFGTNPRQSADDGNTSPRREDRFPETPTFQSPASNIRREKKPPAASGPGSAMPSSIPSAPQAPMEPEDVEVEESEFTDSIPRPRGGRGAFGGGGFPIGTYNGMSDNRDRGNNATEEGRTRPGSWGARTPTKSDMVMSCTADEEKGGGPITPRTALRFKTSAIARAMHN